jgi:hypothetical protein
MRVRRKKSPLRGRPEKSEKGRSKENAAQELADDRGLPDALHELAQQPSDKDQDPDLRQQYELGGVGGIAGRVKRNDR